MRLCGATPEPAQAELPGTPCMAEDAAMPACSRSLFSLIETHHANVPIKGRSERKVWSRAREKATSASLAVPLAVSSTAAGGGEVRRRAWGPADALCTCRRAPQLCIKHNALTVGALDVLQARE